MLRPPSSVFPGRREPVRSKQLLEEILVGADTCVLGRELQERSSHELPSVCTVDFPVTQLPIHAGISKSNEVIVHPAIVHPAIVHTAIVHPAIIR